MKGYALQILSRKGRIYLSTDGNESIHLTTNRKEIELLKERVPCSKIVIFRSRKRKKNYELAE